MNRSRRLSLVLWLILSWPVFLRAADPSTNALAGLAGAVASSGLHARVGHAVEQTLLAFSHRNLASDQIAMTVVDLAAPSAPQLSVDFNAGLPAGTGIAGNSASVDPAGGVGDSGVLKLTTSANDQRGGFRTVVPGVADDLDFEPIGAGLQG